MSKNLALLLLFAAAALLGGFLLLASDPSAEAAGEDLRRAGAASEAGEVGPSADADLATVAEEAVERSRETAAAGAPSAADDAPSAAPSGAPAAEVRGQVVDAQGRAIPGASLRLTQPGDGSEEAVEAEADGEGAFSLMGTGGGGTLLVRADGYVPLERDVRLETASTVALGQLAMSVAGRVSGRVVDPEGRGIAGARISASNDLSLAEMLRGLGNPGDAVESGPDGRFTIATLRPGPYAFRVRREGFLDGAFQGELAREGAEVDGVLVTLDPGVAITGRVTGLPSADAAAALELAVRSAGTEGALALEIPFGEGPFGGRGVELSADGTFRAAGLQAGRRYELFLRAPKAGPLGGAAQRSSVVEARAGDRGVTLGYSEGASVRFVLMDGSGAPVTRAEVSAGLERPRLRIREGDPLPEGAVEIRGLFPKAGGQPLQVSVRAPGKAPWNAEGLRLAPEEALDLGRVTLLDRGQVRVTVRSAAGDAVEGAEVRLVAAATASPGGSRVIRRSMRLSGDLASPEGLEGLLNGEGPGAVGRTDGAGVCTLDADAGSRVDVRVTHPEHAPSRSGPVEVLAVGQVTEHEVRLAAPGWVAVSVVDAKGNPVPDALVESRQSGMRRSGSAPVRTDASGRVQVGPLAAGTARFRLGEESRGPRFAISLSVEADAAGGDGWS